MTAPSPHAATIAYIRATLERELAATSVEIIDDSAKHAGHAGAREGGHFRVTVVSPVFDGKGQLERHRLVYGALASLMGRGIHALNIIARTPQEAS
jgi:BolA protein